MHLHIAGKKPHKLKWTSVAASLTAVAFVSALAFTVTAGAATTTLVVDSDGFGTKNNCDNATTAVASTTINGAIALADPGDTIKVCPGDYTEDVVVNETVALKGAKAGVSVDSRTFGSANESTIHGQVTIQSLGVKLEGFSLTNPGEGLGVVVKTAANDAVVKKNIVDGIGGVGFGSNPVGIYLELGPDNVSVVGNKISHVQSNPSAQGILVGDSSSTNPSLGTVLADNTITDITSANSGAYGIQVNNGAHSTGYSEVEILGNKISTLSGNWGARGVGLEGPTPNAVVKENVVSGLTTLVPGAGVGVFFEENPFFFTSEVNRNSLNVGSANYGVAVATALSTQYPSLDVDGECNWWGASNGPGTLGTGSGSKVGPNVDFSPWLKSARLNKDCGDNNHDHDNDHHWGDWNDHNDDNGDHHWWDD